MHVAEVVVSCDGTHKIYKKKIKIKTHRHTGKVIKKRT